MQMKIGLLDIDYRQSSKTGYAFPNLALCKIAAYHKLRGDVVEWATPFEHYDILYKSKIFNFTEDDLTIYDADEVRRGGTGYSLTVTLPQEIDDMQPDFSIYPQVAKDTSFGFLTRGCPNRCKWCVVPRKEGAVRPYWDIDRVANGKKNVVLMDNNILAAGDYMFEQLQKIIDRGYKIDFNQALDARLVTPEIAKLLARVKWINRLVRFGCDTPKQIQECERAIDLMRQYGYTGEFFLYTMLQGSFDECLRRLSYWRTIKGVNAYAQPYRDPDNPRSVVPQWQKDLASWCNKKMIYRKIPFDQYEPRKGFICGEHYKFK